MNETQLFVRVDPDGNIIGEYSGENIIATEDWDFFFLVDKEIASSVSLYKVVMDGMKPKLVLK